MSRWKQGWTRGSLFAALNIAAVVAVLMLVLALPWRTRTRLPAIPEVPGAPGAQRDPSTRRQLTCWRRHPTRWRCRRHLTRWRRRHLTRSRRPRLTRWQCR